MLTGCFAVAELVSLVSGTAISSKDRRLAMGNVVSVKIGNPQQWFRLIHLIWSPVAAVAGVRFSLFSCQRMVLFVSFCPTGPGPLSRGNSGI